MSSCLNETLPSNLLAPFPRFGSTEIKSEWTSFTFLLPCPTASTANMDNRINDKTAYLQHNVKLTDPSTILTTSQLDYNIERKLAYYYTGGHIVSSNNVLDSRKGYYHSDSKDFYFRDSVVLVNPEYTMHCDTLRFNTVSEIAYFFGPTTIVSDSNTIYCENGWYNTKTEISQYNENAYLLTGKQKLEGDSLYYDRKIGFGKAIGNVHMTDTAEGIILSGNRAIYREIENRAMITDSALLTQIMEGDSLFLHADTLKANYDSTGSYRIIYAFYKAKFFKKDFQGKCDSLIYNFADSTIKMFSELVLWSEENQLTGNQINIFTYEGKMKWVDLLANAFIISKEDSVKYNQIKGKNMRGFFRENKLDQMHVKGNGETIYYPKDEDGGFIGVNKTLCSDMTIFLVNNDISKINFYVKPDANLYPIGELNWRDLRLKNFEWFNDNRPKDKLDIFNWK